MEGEVIIIMVAAEVVIMVTTVADTRITITGVVVITIIEIIIIIIISNGNQRRYTHAATMDNDEKIETVTTGAFPIVHEERHVFTPVVVKTPEADGKQKLQVNAMRTYNKIRSVNLTKLKGGSQVCAHCLINGKSVLAIIDTGAEMSLLRKSISDELNFTVKPAEFDLMSLSNMAVETFGEATTRVSFTNDKKRHPCTGEIFGCARCHF